MKRGSNRTAGINRSENTFEIPHYIINLKYMIFQSVAS